MMDFLNDKFMDKCGHAFMLVLAVCFSIVLICGTIFAVGLLLGVDTANERRGAEYALMDLQTDVRRIQAEVQNEGLDPVSARRVDEVISRKLEELRAK